MQDERSAPRSRGGAPGRGHGGKPARAPAGAGAGFASGAPRAQGRICRRSARAARRPPQEPAAQADPPTRPRRLELRDVAALGWAWSAPAGLACHRGAGRRSRAPGRHAGADHRRRARLGRLGQAAPIPGLAAPRAGRSSSGIARGSPLRGAGPRRRGRLAGRRHVCRRARRNVRARRLALAGRHGAADLRDGGLAGPRRRAANRRPPPAPRPRRPDGSPGGGGPARARAGPAALGSAGLPLRHSP